MKIYRVGGAVRDHLRGVASKDNDYVVVGSTPEEMVSLGYVQVGADFPVFLHPKTHDEYALARIERKTGVGYNGFSTDTRGVTLEEDLSRRDLTINAMALDAEDRLVDPYGGKQDLENKVLRHVSTAFSEDPLRILRVARFLARFGDEWTVAPETERLMMQMVADSTMDTLAQERVWVEIEKGLTERHSDLMVGYLRKLNILTRPAFAEYSAGLESDLNVLAVAGSEDVTVKFALGFARTWSDTEAKTSRIPRPVRQVAQTLAEGIRLRLDRFADFTPDEKADILEKLDGVRQKERSQLVARALSFVPGCGRHAEAFNRAVMAASGLKIGELLNGLKDPKEIKARVREARSSAIALLDEEEVIQKARPKALRP